MRSTIARGTAAVTGTALALSLGLLAPSAQAAPIPAPAGTDPSPAAKAAAYLAAQPEASGIITSYYDFPVGPPFESSVDYGLTIDTAWALDAVGGQATKLAAMTTALEDNIPNYAFGGGSQAKISAFLLSQGVGSTEVMDVVADIEDDHIADAAPIVGRLVDADPNDFNTPLTQAFAVSALNNAGSDLANAALGFLLDQQCEEGFFRDSFAAKDAADQTCDGAASPSGSVDTTGTALLMLQDQKSKPLVKAAITDALDWLEASQAANGSFNSGNANSTGLAGWVLGLGGRTASATEAAGWLRGQQLANAGACAPHAADVNGAVILDSLGLTNAADGLDDIENSSATRATAQAAPALLWAPGGASAGAFTLTGPTGFKPAGSAQQYSIQGAPGDTVCVSSVGAPTKVVLGATGAGTVTVNLPAATTSVSVSAVDAGGETHARSVTGLAKATLGVKLKKETVAKGKKVVVTVSGLASGESVTVTLGDKKVKATAKANGKAKVKMVATEAGPAKVKAVGEFKNRKGKANLTVTA